MRGSRHYLCDFESSVSTAIVNNGIVPMRVSLRDTLSMHSRKIALAVINGADYTDEWFALYRHRFFNRAFCFGPHSIVTSNIGAVTDRSLCRHNLSTRPYCEMIRCHSDGHRSKMFSEFFHARYIRPTS